MENEEGGAGGAGLWAGSVFVAAGPMKGQFLLKLVP
jgi:hypothetical protein